MSKLVFEHRRRTKREGLWALVASVLTMGGLVTFEMVLFPWVRERDPVFHYIFCGMALLIGCGIIFLYAIPNMRMDREFRFLLFDDHMECRCPAEAFGESYSIALNEIVMLEEDTTPETSEWYFITRDDRRIRINRNYGNRVRRVVNELRALRPELPVKRV
ncbi:MAG: hypothetical protein JW809_20045 [Pirellulales bacterium]|nr:hypothetical protein [Pirellulales bacterium]